MHYNIAVYCLNKKDISKKVGIQFWKDPPFALTEGMIFTLPERNAKNQKLYY